MNRKFEYIRCCRRCQKYYRTTCKFGKICVNCYQERRHNSGMKITTKVRLLRKKYEVN